MEEEDVALAGRTADEIGEDIERHLWMKGFCVLDMKFEASLDDALDEVKELRRDELFGPPPPQVVEGLLGTEGSGEIAWLSMKASGPKLQALNRDLFYIADCTRHFFASQGLQGININISETLVVQGGELTEDAGELTEADCSKWVSTFLSAKLMMVYFMGPGDGTLELIPIDDDAEPMTIKTRPDMLVILRSDIITRRHTSSSSDYALCSWIMLPSVTGNRGWEAMSTDASDSIPGVKELNDWAEDRLQVLATLDYNDELHESVPRAWQRMFRTKYFRNSNLPVAICGMATHSPGTQDCEALWKSLNVGVDYVGNIPLHRWNHEEYYDPDPQCFMYSTMYTGWGAICKTSIRHAQNIDGIELFDNKFFQISQSEATGMDAQQRHILETSYEGLYMAGYNKKQLMNAYIAVFTGCTNPEAMYIQYSTGAGAGNVSQAITSNRTSFVLGIMGPSTSIDCEMASSHMALMVGCSAVAPNHQWRNSTGGHSDAAITGGVYLMLTPYMWPRFNAYMNPIGRCLTFDASGSGYVRGESCTSLCQKPYTERVDGDWVVNDNYTLGTMVGWRMSNNGRSASLTAPNAAAQQDAVYHAMCEAGIRALDMDAVECHGNGNELEDSVEVTAIGRILRHEDGSDTEPVFLGSVKSQVAAQCESCGMSSFLKAMLNILFAVHSPSLHLNQVNPHMEYPEDSVFMLNEHLPFREQYVFAGCQSRGFNGSNTHIVMWYRADEARVRTERLLSTEEPIVFWPAGGGVLDNAARPSDGYFVIGSFTGGDTPQEMQQVSESVYTYTITLGVNRLENFQVLLDADADRVLHPRAPQGASGSTVAGPSEAMQAVGYTWTIDGRTLELPALAEGATPAGAIADTQASALGAVEVAEQDTGRPGDRYEIKLSVAGKYRAMTWRKVEAAPEDALKDPIVHGRYYVVGSWNDWRPQEMAADHNVAPGVFALEIGPLPLWSSRCDFQIIRNKDWNQTFHPAYGTIASPEWNEAEVWGPDEGGPGATWCIKGGGGEHFKIELQRSLENGQDLRRICWHRLPVKT